MFSGVITVSAKGGELLILVGSLLLCFREFIQHSDSVIERLADNLQDRHLLCAQTGLLLALQAGARFLKGPL